MDEEAIQLWDPDRLDNHEKPRLFSYLAITIAFIIKHGFSMLWKGAQEFINFISKLTQLLLLCPYYSCISKPKRLTSHSKLRLKEPSNT
ncbi:transposase [Candidatus Enterovibrio altilux]